MQLLFFEMFTNYNKMEAAILWYTIIWYRMVVITCTHMRASPEVKIVMYIIIHIYMDLFQNPVYKTISYVCMQIKSMTVKEYQYIIDSIQLLPVMQLAIYVKQGCINIIQYTALIIHIDTQTLYKRFISCNINSLNNCITNSWLLFLCDVMH